MRSPANFVHYLPPPSCLRWCKLGQPTYSPAAIWAMQWHGGKTCPCRCIARFLPVFFFAANSCVRAHTIIEKIPFPSCRAHHLPFPPFNPNNTPPPTCAPLSPTFIRRRVMHVLLREGWGGGNGDAKARRRGTRWRRRRRRRRCRCCRRRGRRAPAPLSLEKNNNYPLKSAVATER